VPNLPITRSRRLGQSQGPGGRARSATRASGPRTDSINSRTDGRSGTTRCVSATHACWRFQAMTASRARPPQPRPAVPRGRGTAIGHGLRSLLLREGLFAPVPTGRRCFRPRTNRRARCVPPSTIWMQILARSTPRPALRREQLCSILPLPLCQKMCNDYEFVSGRLAS
jgi:hypothetical protein